MRSVRISVKAAHALLGMSTPDGFTDPLERRALEELRAALKPKRSVKAAKVRRETKRKTRREFRSDLRAQLELRAGGCCEACGISDRFIGPLHWDHFFGRIRVPEEVATGWLLCPGCHGRKTDNAPSSAYWLRLFATHAHKHGYSGARDMALRRAEALELSRGEAVAS